MTREEAVRALLKAPNHTLKYRGSGFGNALAASLARDGIIELRNEWGPKCTMQLTSWGQVWLKCR